MARPVNPVAPPPPPSNTKPLPSPTPNDDSIRLPKRPGTSGTEAALKTTRRQASATLKQASRAERVYRARKRSAASRANLIDAQDHLRQARQHFALGAKLLGAVVRGWPYVLREKWEARRVKGEEEKRKKAVEKRKRLDERIAATAAVDGDDEEGGHEEKE